MRRIVSLSALLLGLAGCSLSIDPDSVPPPVVPGCTPVCAGKTCGDPDTCGGTCQAATSTCTPPTTTHTIQRGQLTPGAGSTSAIGAHSVAQGTLSGGAGNMTTPSAHSISQGTLSP
jgi:hypothetical protein